MQKPKTSYLNSITFAWEAAKIVLVSLDFESPNQSEINLKKVTDSGCLNPQQFCNQLSVTDLTNLMFPVPTACY